MTPKQWIKYVKWLEKRNIAICDGSMEQPLFGQLETMLIVFGLIGIVYLIKYKIIEWIKNK